MVETSKLAKGREPMSVAEHLSPEVTPAAPRRQHAAVAALVGGPYPNLVTSARPRPRLVVGPEPLVPSAGGAEPAGEEAPIDLRRTDDTGFPAGGPYPNLATARP